MGVLLGIYTAPSAREAMISCTKATLETGRGIVGDRYHAGVGTFSNELSGKPDVEETLIESEQIAYFNAEATQTLSDGDTRRNLVTEGVDLNALVGKRFRVGTVELEGIRLCEPCAHLAREVASEVLPVLVHRAGLRAKIVRDGEITLGDAVAEA